MGLQDEVDRETERLAASLRERREEEDQQIEAEVRGAPMLLLSPGNEPPQTSHFKFTGCIGNLGTIIERITKKKVMRIMMMTMRTKIWVNGSRKTTYMWVL